MNNNSNNNRRYASALAAAAGAPPDQQAAAHNRAVSQCLPIPSRAIRHHNDAPFSSRISPCIPAGSSPSRRTNTAQIKVFDGLVATHWAEYPQLVPGWVAAREVELTALAAMPQARFYITFPSPIVSERC